MLVLIKAINKLLVDIHSYLSLGMGFRSAPKLDCWSVHIVDAEKMVQLQYLDSWVGKSKGGILTSLESIDFISFSGDLQ